MGRGWDRILEKYGPIAAIALFLVWWLVSDVSGGLRALASTLNDHVSDMQLQKLYLRAICRNTAKNPVELQGCEDIGR